MITTFFHRRTLRLRYILSAVALALLAGCGPPSGETTPEPLPQPDAPPNIVVIVADDLGYGDVCAYSCEGGRTPNIDTLAASGIRFTDGYVSAPLCSPTRAGLLTGRYQQRFGHEFGAGDMARTEEAGLGTPTDEIMLPALLGEAGYATGMVGKWHLGSQPQFQPQHRGFDEFFGFLHGGNLYMDPADQPGVHTVAAHTVAGGRRPDEYRHRPPINPIQRGAEPVAEEEYLTDAFTREAVDFIDRHQQEPFFLYVAYNAPHTPLQVTQEYYDRFPDIADDPHRIFAAMVSALDDGVGAIMSKLRSAGLEERTLVLFLSDNGCASYVKACYNDPLTGGKLSHFEGGVRVPFLASWQGRISPGRVESTPVSSLDILPTALALAGLDGPSDRVLDGIDLVPLLTGEENIPSRSLFWRNAENFAVRSGSWKLVSVNERAPYLFDLSKGEADAEDVAVEHQDRIDALLEEYRNWESEMREPLWTPVNRGPVELWLPWLGIKEVFELAV